MKKLFSLSLAFVTILGLTGITTAKTLLITDSHGEGHFGQELVSLIEKSREEVSAYAVGGSTPTDWVYGQQQTWGYWEHHTNRPPIRYSKPVTPKLENLLSPPHFDRVIVVLGTNLLWREHRAEDIYNIEKITSLINATGAKCIWVGPPDLKPKFLNQKSRVLEIQDMLKELLPKINCELIRSWEFTHYPQNKGDGIHYDQIPRTGTQLAQKWALDVFKQL